MDDAKASPREVLRDALLACVEETCAITKARAAGQPPYLEEKEVWERGEDGAFRFRRIAVPFTGMLFIKYGPKLEELASYRKAMEAAQGDPVVAPQMNTLVGAAGRAAVQLKGDAIVRSLTSAMVKDDGHIEFSKEQFEKKWEEIASDLYSGDMTGVTISPLPRVVGPFPIKLAQGIELDRLTDEEVGYCTQVRLLGERFPGIGLIPAEEVVGLRCVAPIAKIAGNEGISPDAGKGEFGRRPSWAQGLLLDDVLTALRLVKEGSVRSPGNVSVIKGWHLGGMRQFAFRGGSPFYFNQYELSEIEGADLKGVWTQLCSGVLEQRRFLAASLRRFNLALDRDLMEDRIVDLMIAAESLFLHDAGKPQDRGEARFRLSLRAAAFVDSPRYSRRQVFRVMREGYDIRSRVVHGGSVEKARLPDKPDATVNDVASAIEGIMRVGLRKGLVTSELVEEGFWDALLLPDQGPTC